MIRIEMTRHPEGLTATYAEATVDDELYTSIKVLPIKDRDGNPVVQTYREGAVYDIMLQLLAVGYAGELFQVWVEDVLIMNGVLNHKHIPTHYKT